MENSKICRLCLSDNADIELFSDNGRHLQIAVIVAEHFWFEPSEDDIFSNLICTCCWSNLKQFHTFYVDVKKAQEKLINPTENCNNKCSLDIGDTDNIIVVKEEKVVVDRLKNEVHEENVELDEDKIDSQDIVNYDDPYESFSDKASDYSNDSSSSSSSSIDNRPRTRNRTKNANATSATSTVTNNNTGSIPKKRGRPPKLKKIEPPVKKRKYVKRNRDNDAATALSAIEKVERRNQRIEEDQKIRDFFELACTLCSFHSTTFVAVKAHYRQAHSLKRGYVVCCDKKFFRRGRILEHITWHGNPDTFQCPICNKSYKDTHSLKIHMPNHASEDERIFKCDLCNKTYAKKYNLTQHMRITHVPAHMKIHKCDKCGKSFGTKSILQSHVRGVHEFAYVSVCDICAKVFKSKAQCALHRHQEHSLEKKQKLQCSICETWHKNENGLYKHIRRSHHQSPQSCEICGKISPNRDALRSHIRYVHESERLHKCSVCDKAFKKPIELKEHMASHTGGILYVCPYCPKTFNSNANMHSHRKKMHPIEWQEDRDRKCGPGILE